MMPKIGLVRLYDYLSCIAYNKVLYHNVSYYIKSLYISILTEMCFDQLLLANV